MNRPRNRNQQEKTVKEFQETVIQIKRVSKKTKGGNQIGFTALVVVGDLKGKVGVGLGKAKDVSTAIRKAIAKAKKRMITLELKGTTIPREIEINNKSAHILLKPSRQGSGMVAGGAVRAIAAAAGIKDLVGKIIGTRNKTLNTWTTFEAFKRIAVKNSKNA